MPMSFKDDLAFGQDSERLLLDQYPFLERTDGRKSDLRIKGTNILIEKKADSHDMNKYGNIIIEKFSKEEKLGGPFSALENGCRYFAYTFVQNRKTFVFKTDKLVERVNKLAAEKNLKLFETWNPGYTTRFFKVKITDLEDLDVGMEKLQKLHDQAEKRRAKKVK